MSNKGNRVQAKLKKDNLDRWLLTYSDMITLLMIFFIVLYTISSVNQTKYQTIARSLGLAMGTSYIFGDKSGKLVGDYSELPNESSMQQLESNIQDYIQKNHLQNYASIRTDERGLVISIEDSVFFAKGSAEIEPDKQQMLKSIADLIKKLPNYIRVEGYTDNLPIHTEKYRSNWELSVSRATNVINALVQNGVNPEKLIAVGYGEYKPRFPNNSEENRAKNRRVDIVIMDLKYNKWEPAR